MFLSVISAIRDGDKSMTNKTDVAIVLAIGLLLFIGCVVGQQNVLHAENYTLLNLTEFAAESPIDPKIGYSIEQALLGKNASINLAQLAPGSHFDTQYHSASDEIDFIIQGQANATINDKVLSVKAGDMLYLPSGTVHNYEARGNEKLLVFVVFAPPLGKEDRHLV
jgi:mannose-6-phosphate isomerase-like protein (cupin superfamily)